MNYPTPHIDAKPEDFASTVLMPGDPLRSKFVAENFLESPCLVNNVRGVQGYTGYYKGKRVSVMASGMGMPSMAIYSYELFNFFGVENIIRIGSAGGMQERVKVRDIVLGMAASTDSNYVKEFSCGGTYTPMCSYELLEKAVNISKESGLRYHVGNILSSDVFYSSTPQTQKWQGRDLLAVEMEAAALYVNAARAGKRALSILTVSDHLLTGESLPASERQDSFKDMMHLALEVAFKMEE
jgi:purine-nucleoside phosphorylase